MLTITADDFGYSDDANRAIVECFACGFCSSTSIMANMPAFEAGCELAHRHGFVNQVGAHLVLTEGEPLTAGICKCPRLCDSHGHFRLSRMERVWRLSAAENDAVAEELRAQILRCRQFGLPLSHADSHDNIHEEWALLPILMHVCSEENIQRVRIARNCGASTGLLRSLYRALVNQALRRRGLARTERFGSLFDVFHALINATPLKGMLEVMVHPAFDAQGVLFDMTTGIAMAEAVRVLHTAGIGGHSALEYRRERRGNDQYGTNSDRTSPFLHYPLPQRES